MTKYKCLKCCEIYVDELDALMCCSEIETIEDGINHYENCLKNRC